MPSHGTLTCERTYTQRCNLRPYMAAPADTAIRPLAGASCLDEVCQSPQKENARVESVSHLDDRYPDRRSATARAGHNAAIADLRTSRRDNHRRAALAE